jgi:uncharacterized phage protein (TIGR02218 family)
MTAIGTVPEALQDHLDTSATTTCRLLKFKLKSGLVFGLTTLDADIVYDDASGDGEITYVATNGFDPSALEGDINFTVGNGEGNALLSNPIPGITEEMIRAGEMDDATWVCYLVNYKAIGDSPGNEHFILDAGDVGQVRIKYGMLWMPELLSYVMRLKQPIGSVWSRKCRAIFGSSPSSQTGCGIDVTSLWVAGSVSSVGGETDRTFTGSAVATLPATNYPARVQFLTGDNAGREFAVEEVNGLVVDLIETTPYPIAPGDTYRMRKDCQKRYEEDCIAIYSNGPNFKGEPHIPVGDGTQSQTPSAQLPGGGVVTHLAREVIDDLS